jgi:hypothetical protein
MDCLPIPVGMEYGAVLLVKVKRHKPKDSRKQSAEHSAARTPHKKQADPKRLLPLPITASTSGDSQNAKKVK